MAEIIELATRRKVLPHRPRIENGYLFVDGQLWESFTQVRAVLSGDLGGFVAIGTDGNAIFTWEGQEGFESYQPYSIPLIEVVDGRPFEPGGFS